MAEITTAADAEKSDAPKNKLVRDSFTIPKAEYAVLNELKQRATRLTRPAKKSEILRAGIELLKGLSDAAFLAALASVPNLKTGRPPKEGDDEADGEKVKRHVKDKTAPKAKAAGANGAAAAAAKPERAAARAARAAARPQKAARTDKPARAGKPITPEKQAAKAAKQAAKGRSTT